MAQAELATETASEGRAAVARGDWPAGYDLLSAADAARALPRVALGDFADAAYMTSRPDQAISIWERAHAAALRDDDVDGAASAALRMSMLLADTTQMVPLRAWLRRLDDLLEGREDSVTATGAAVLHAYTDLMTGHVADGLEWADRAVAGAERLHDRGLLALARNAKARLLIAKGEIKDGLSLLDEAAVAAVAGDLDAFTSGVLYCSTVCACQSIGEYQRAEEWTSAMERWTDTAAHPKGFHGRCRVHRAQIEMRRGEWSAAAINAKVGAEELRTFAPIEEGWGLSELGLLQLRLGDLDSAQEAFDGAFAAGWDPEPGLALLKLARGDVAGADALIRDAIADPMNSPSREVPPSTELRRAPVLEAQVEIAAVKGDAERAKWASTELTAIADHLDLPMLRASAAVAEGRALLAAGDAAAARERFGAGFRIWQELGAPYEQARARMGIADAARAMGNEERATMEYRAARQVFERLGARLDAQAAALALGEKPADAVDAPTRITKVFMFTDIVGSTNLLAAMGDDAWRQLLRWHDGTIRAIVNAHRGVIVSKLGDGFFVAFDDPADGLNAAVGIQRALHEHRRDHGFAPQVRIGLHRAEATFEDDNYSGGGVHLAARIGAVAEGGQIVVSRETAVALGGGAASSPVEVVSLKGFTEPVEVVRLDWTA
jgi:class 3 adenylate cyclase